MSFLDKFIDYIKNLLIGGIKRGLEQLFVTINREVENVGQYVSVTPESWNGNLWDTMTGIADSVILPLAGCILAFAMCFEMVSILNDKNNMHDGSEVIYSLIRALIKMMIAVLIVKNSQQIISAMFNAASAIVRQASSYISGNTALDPEINAAQIAERLKEEEIQVVIGVLGSLFLTRFILWLVAFIVQLVMIGRMMEIYIYCSIAPIPMATFMGKEINSIGINYIKSIAALALQSFFIMLCMGIYSALIQDLATSSDDLGNLFSSLSVCAAVLAYSLFKTGQMAKSIFTAH